MRKMFLFMLILATSAGLTFAQSALSLDEAIEKGAGDINNRLASGLKVVVLNFNSPAERFSNYVLDEMIGYLVNGGRLTVVDRQNLTLIQEEMHFQMSGEVSDESAQEIGRKLGAQSIISGSLEDMGTNFRIRFRTIEVVSAAIQVSTSLNIRKDNQTNILLSGAAGTANTAATRNQPAAGTSSPGGGYPNGLNFSTGRKVNAGFLNLFFGLGSFTMGDIAGGFIVGGLQLAGYLVIANADPYSDAENLLGIGINLGSIIYGFIRPFSYDTALAKKNGTWYATNPLNHINIALVPDNRGIRAVHLSYRASL